MEEILKRFLDLEEVKRGSLFSSCSPTLAGIVLALKHKILKEKILILVPSEEEGKKIELAVKIFLDGEKVKRIPEIPLSPYKFLNQPIGTKAKIIEGFYSFYSGSSPFLIINSKFLPYPFLNFEPLILKTSKNYNYYEIIENLNDFFYSRVPEVEDVGDFAVRGSIIDFYSPNYENPIRLEFFGDEILSIRFFDKETQKSLEKANEVFLIPMEFERRKNIEKKRKYFEGKVTGLGGKKILEDPQFYSIFSIFSIEKKKREGNFSIAFYYTNRIKEIWEESYEKLLKESYESKEAGYFDLDPRKFFYSSKEDFFTPNFQFEPIGLDRGNSIFLKTRSLGIVPQNIKTFEREYKELLKEKYTIYLFFSNKKNEKILKKFFEEKILSPPIFVGRELKENCILEDLKLALISSNKILGEPPLYYKIHIPKDFSYKGEIFKKGERVVHEEYGIGIYEGLFEMEGSEFLKIRYADGNLYLPVEKLNFLSPYPKIENPQALDYLGKKSFLKKKRKIQKNLKSLLQDLLNLYALRSISRGISFKEEGFISKAVEETFPYGETEDQKKCWEEVKEDMEKEEPMDRLISGDVGFGKTEIAIRASVKAVENGYQVAILCPTTLLAFQHFRTFKERFSNIPINLYWLSRFLSKRVQREIIEKLKSGEVDIVIGTHRLLSKDISFKKLGLLIVDEEQRFGVSHKEKLRILKKNVDTITLTATPIPRTFHMAFLGLKSISLIGTPPPGRFPVETLIVPFNPLFIKEAISYEIKRGGQVFFVNNKIEDLDRIYLLLKELLPELKIVITHGKMDERILENNMLKFVQGEADLLLTTTIIENGIDIPRANTLFIRNAQNFGLAQLYQIRGRVGRSDKQAFCYFLIPPKEKISRTSLERLRVLEEFTALGSGFKVAARDFEMRGAGEILGKAQSGHMETLGYDLYLKLLQKSINELKGIEMEEEVEISLKVRYEIPHKYIPEESLRLKVYRMLLEKDPEEIEENLKDKFGPLPEEVKLLIDISRIRKIMKKIKIQRIEKQKDKLILKVLKGSSVSFDKWLKLVNKLGGKFQPENIIILPCRKEGKDLIYFIKDILMGLL